MGTIRLVVLDMGGTLWEEVPDSRAVFHPDGDGHGDVFYRIDARHMYRADGVSNRMFPGVRELFEELSRRGLCVSINSLNTPDAWRWIERDIFNLNAGDVVRHSRIGEHPDPEKRRAPQKTDIKGTWTAEIIADWNANELRGEPIANDEVLFVDDDEWNHRAVGRVCPGVHCVFPPIESDRGMLDVIGIIHQIDGGDATHG